MEHISLPDTDLSVINQQENIRIDGLYFVYNGEKKQPHKVYFGIDFYPNKCKGGSAFIYYDNALRPVYCSDGTRLVIPHLRNVTATYKDSTLNNFHRE